MARPPRPGETTGVVFNVQRASFHDGPGIRTTVFLKGCPLACPWCHNPESVQPLPEVSVDATRCLDCGACVAACVRVGGPLPAGAVVGVDGCSACGACFDACPVAARQAVGSERGVTEVMDEVLRDRLAFETSGGGATFSGGEPLRQAGFLLACLRALRAEGIHLAVDTCGVAPRATVVAVAAAADLLLWDVKHLDPQRHEELTGAPLAPILANLAAAATVGVPIWLRVPVVPGLNDGADNLAAVACLAAATPGVERVCLLPYHGTGTGKLARLGRAADAPVWPTPGDERLAALAEAVSARGIVATIGG